jgi:abnormal spindle-like microcephaly-associated protein
VLPYSSATDVLGLSQFIVQRLLNNPDLQREFAHPTVPHHYAPGFQDALKQFTLRKFLQLVFFLDQAKQLR